MKIVTNHPQFSACHPTELARDYLANKFEPVDFAFSYSSFEHDGLGELYAMCVVCGKSERCCQLPSEYVVMSCKYVVVKMLSENDAKCCADWVSFVS